jgi:hypothetical protein
MIGDNDASIHRSHFARFRTLSHWREKGEAAARNGPFYHPILPIMDINQTTLLLPSLRITSPLEDEDRTKGRRQAESKNVRTNDGALSLPSPKKHKGDTARHTALMQQLPFTPSTPSKLVNDAPSEIVMRYASFASIQDLKSMRMANKALRRAANTFVKHVKHVQVRDPAELQSALTFYKEVGLTSIQLSYSRFTDTHLGLLQNTALETVRLDRCDNITDASLAKIYRGVKSLNLHWCGNITDAGLLNIPRGVERLEIWGIHITDAGLANLPRGLKMLALRHCTDITDTGLGYIPDSVTVLDLTGRDRKKITRPGIETLRARLAPGSVIY